MQFAILLDGDSLFVVHCYITALLKPAAWQGGHP